MKKFVKMFALAVMLFAGGQMIGQTHGYMYLGASFPMSSFGYGSSFTNIALSGNYDDGGAGIGFNAGFKWNFGVGVKGLNVMLSVDGFYNGPNSNMKDDYKNVKKEWEKWNENVSLTSAKYINVPAMLGLHYCYYINPMLGVYAEAAAGGNMGFITDYTVKGTSKLFEKKNSEVFDYENSFGFAWQAGVGLEVSKNLVLGCSFYDLGTSQVKGEIAHIVEGEGLPSVDINKNANLHPVMVLGRIGFRF